MGVKIKNKELIQKIKCISEKCIGKELEGKDICKKCVQECEFLKEVTTSPKVLFEDISRSEEVEKIIPYSCNMCKKCTSVCPKNLDLADSFWEMRKEIVLNSDGKVPLKGYSGVDMHQKLSFSNIFSITKKGEESSQNQIFMPGCSLASYNPILLEKLISFLNEKSPKMSTTLKCCGKPTKLIGKEDIFQQRYNKLQNEFNKLEIDEVIVACQNCVKTISENSIKPRVTSIWEYLIKTGIPKEAKGIGRDSDIVFSIHDSCSTREKTEIHNSIRWIINEMGYKVEEMENSRENTKCCGMGGMVAAGNFQLAKKVMKKRAEESTSDYIITYCASCTNAMTIAGKKSFHILDLIFGEPVDSTTFNSMKVQSSLKNWTNRYKSKKIIKREY